MQLLKAPPVHQTAHLADHYSLAAALTKKGCAAEPLCSVTRRPSWFAVIAPPSYALQQAAGLDSQKVRGNLLGVVLSCLGGSITPVIPILYLLCICSIVHDILCGFCHLQQEQIWLLCLQAAPSGERAIKGLRTVGYR